MLADQHYVRAYVVARVAQTLATEAPPDRALDEHVVRFYTPAEDVAALIDRLSPLIGSSRREAAISARAFTPFGAQLVRISAGEM